MTGKFKNKYRTESNRLQNWDYSANGYYFVTIVSNKRSHWFGEIVDTAMARSDFGNIVNNEWLKSFTIRNELFLDQFVIMPNHLHAIIILHTPTVETHGRASLQPMSKRQTSKQPKFHLKPKSISSFIAGFKSATTNKIDDYIDLHNLDIAKFNRNNRLWQPNYHDHIIRDENELFKIREYIINNPAKWADDKLNTL